MSFAGTFGPAAAFFPFAIIANEKLEIGAGYDADGRLKFTRASGQVYTPARVDTLIITGLPDGQQVAPLGALVAGLPDTANADSGAMVTAAAAAGQHGLPTNFGPGRGKWAGPTGKSPRLRVTFQPILDVDEVDPTLGQGSVQMIVTTVLTNNLLCGVRNYHGQDLEALVMVVECVHTVQG